MKKRSYMQNCSLAHALDVLGERWTLLMIREFLTGPKRYRDLTERLRGMGTNLLAERLKWMIAEGLLQKTGTEYSLTDKGWATEDIVLQLVRWNMQFNGARSSEVTARTGENQELLHIADWDKVAMKALFKSRVKFKAPFKVRLRLSGHDHFLLLVGNKLDITHSNFDAVDLAISGDQEVLSSLQSKAEFETVVNKNIVHVDGDKELAWDFMCSFGM